MPFETSTAETADPTATSTASQGVWLKRSIAVKTLITDAFRERAKTELSQESQTLDDQLSQIDAQFQASLKQLEEAARQGHNVSRPMDQLHREVQQHRAQVQGVRQELANQLANLDNVANGSYVTTGQLENFVQIKVGDDIYKKLRGAELLVKDGVVTAILESH